MAVPAGPDRDEDITTIEEKEDIVNGAAGEVLVACRPSPKYHDKNKHDVVMNDHKGTGGVNPNDGKAVKIAIYGAVNAMMAIPILYGYAAIIFRWAGYCVPPECEMLLK